jgi:hypothetical protein
MARAGPGKALEALRGGAGRRAVGFLMAGGGENGPENAATPGVKRQRFQSDTEEREAVRRRPHDNLGANIGAATGAVFYDELLAGAAPRTTVR